MRSTQIIKILLVAEIAVLLSCTFASYRDYQDTWILEGLEVPFAILAATYVAYIFVEKDVKQILLFSLVFRFAWLLVPLIKYPWFLGVAIDQHYHYRLAQNIQDIGFIPSGTIYSGTPLMHVFFAAYSLTTGAPLLDSFKYLPILWWGSYPLLIYVLLSKLKLGESHPSILKYAVVIACIPARTTLSYVVVSALFGVFLVFFFLYQLACVLQTNAHEYWLLALVGSIALVSAHTYSSTTLLVVLSLTFLASTFVFKRFRLRYFKVTLLIFLAVLNAAWLLYQAPVLYGRSRDVILTFIRALQGFQESSAFVMSSVKPRFFQLDIVSSFKTLAVFNGADFFLLLLMLLGILLVIKKFRSSAPLKFLSLYVLCAWAYYALQLLLGRGFTELVSYERIFEHTLIWSPILGGAALYYLGKKAPALRLPVIAVSLLMILAPIQLYGFQPLIPSSSVLSNNLSSSAPVTYVGIVNSIYQRSLIAHAEKHIEKGFIASDRVTTHQTVGLTSYDFSITHVMYYYPFSRLIDNTTKRREYDYFLIHAIGRGGVIQEPVEIRTPSLIQAAIYNSSVTYNNGQSYILQRPFLYEDS